MIKNQTASTIDLFAWALYDWANSAFFAVVQTFVFATYFIQSVAANETTGSAQWGYTISAAGLVIALAGPLLGAFADQFGRRKPWIIVFSFLCIGATAALWFVRPGEEFTTAALILIFLGTVGSEYAIIFYNAMLPDLAPADKMGRWSGWAWGLGYAGGTVCLLVALFGFIQAEVPPFGLNLQLAEPVRATFILVAVWYFLFSLPLFIITPDTPQKNTDITACVQNGWRQLRESVSHLHEYRHIARFLIARMIFIDGLATLFAFGGIYAAGTFNMDAAQVLKFGVGLNITAGVGAALFSWVDDRMGSRYTMLISLGALIIITSFILMITSSTWFWITGLALGLFVGPVQAASRTYMARVAPAHLKNQMFGLLALSGKVTAFIGPFLVGWLTYAAGSQRVGMSIIVALFILGFVLLLRVPEADEAPAKI